PSHYSRKERLQNFTKSKSSPLKTQGQLAREQAREDLKRKQHQKKKTISQILITLHLLLINHQM
ncbi:hypothetical protein RFG29_09625, partial [Streptococcus ruminantium]|nr:hypothetical protein [Streptococcus ruminantium]